MTSLIIKYIILISRSRPFKSLNVKAVAGRLTGSTFAKALVVGIIE